MKYCKVEVYLLEFKLCIHPKTSETVSKMFSRADTIGRLYLLVDLLHVYTHTRMHMHAQVHTR